ncbi:MAG: beta-lactamase family protein [Saprospiraceae bacterium]|nr:beta-lactamase family protein [Saprospiraceae bacterium]
MQNRLIAGFTLPFSFCLFFVCASAQIEQQDSINLFIEHQASRFHVPGIAACVVKGDKVVWASGFGYASIEREEAMSASHVMNIASISKTITATAVMQLWEKEKLELDRDINDYLDFTVRNPNHPQRPISIRQLLTHSSSIEDAMSLKIGYQCGDPARSLKDWIQHYFDEKGEFYDPKENFLEDAPGEIHQYSNVGFGLLGLLVETVAEMPFHEYVKAHVFGPLKMKDSGYFLSEIDSSRLVTSYLYLGALQKSLPSTTKAVLPYFNPYCQYSFWNYPDGLVRTSVLDLAKFATAFMNEGVYEGARVLEKESIDSMMTLQLDKSVNEDQDQGLSWFQSSSLYPTWYHGGSDPGVSTRMYINKEDKLACIVFQNANVDNTYYIIRELYDRFKD